MSKERELSKQKVLFELEKSDHHEFAAETIWAEILGENRYRLLNIPLYVYGASFGDVVVAYETDEETSFPIVEEVVERSGHSTYRILVFEGAVDNPTFNRFWEPIEAEGCAFEGQTGNKMLGVDVPPEANINLVFQLLQKGEDAEAWGFEEGNCVHVSI